MTGTMVMRVARALADIEYQRNAQAAAIFGEAAPPRKDDDWVRHVDSARAAIEAMREPTPEMLAAALPLTGVHCDPASERLAERALFIVEPPSIPLAKHRLGRDAALALIGDYRAMINAALQEENEHG